MTSSVETAAVEPSVDSERPAVDPVSTVAAPAVAVAGAGERLPSLTVACRELGLLSLVGWSVGMLLGMAVLKGDLEGFVTRNAIGMGGRRFLLVAMFGGAALAFGAGAAFLFFRRRQDGAVQRLEQIAKRLSPLCLAGFIPFLFHWKFWIDRELQFLFAVAGFSLAAWASARAALGSPPLLGAGPRSSRLRQRLRPLSALVGDVAAGRRWPRLPLAIVIAAAAGYTALFSAYTITNHRNLRTSAFDLGMEENLVWNILHGIGFFRSTTFGGPTGTHFGNHATFFSYVIAPFYALSQHAETLLFIQALLIGVAAVPLYLYARRHLTPWMACAIAVGYLLYPPVHGANLYEFHYIPLGAFFLWMTLYLFETHHDRWATVMTILALSVREDIGPAAVSVLGAYLLITGKRPRPGAILAVVGAVSFALLKLVFMPLVSGIESFIVFYKDLFPAGQDNFAGVLKTVFGNPFYTLGTLLERSKLVYMLQYLVPLAFLPLRRPIVLLLAVPGIFFTVLSTGYQPLIEISFQYTFFWTVFLFIGLVDVLESFGQGQVNVQGAGAAVAAWSSTPRARAAIVAFCCAMLPVSYQVGAVFQRHTAHSGFGRFNFETTARDLADRAPLQAIIASIPPRASVAASDSLTAHITNRPNAYTLRGSIYPDVEYLLFYSERSRIDGGEREKIAAALGTGEFGVVEVRGPFAIARRGHSTALNNGLLQSWGGGWRPGQ